LFAGLVFTAYGCSSLGKQQYNDNDGNRVAYDLWQRLRESFTLPDLHHPKIHADLRWYASHPEYIQRVTERAQPYLHFIVEELESREMPNEIALLPIVESAFNPFAYSHGRASGIWQFIPATGKRFGMKQDWWYDGRRDIYASTMGALDYLQHLHKRLNNDWLLALAAYNSGAGNVRKAIRRSVRRGGGTDFWSIRPYLPKETRGYVPKLLAISAVVLNPELYSIELYPIANEPYLQRVDFDSQIDLALAADLAYLSLEELYRLNPAYNRWATSPDGPHYFMLPLANAELFQQNLAMVPSEERMQWARHRIRRGETLVSISTKYHTTVAEVKRLNKIHSNRLKVGSYLIIPVASKNQSAYTLTAEQRKRRLQHTQREGTKVVYQVQPGDSLWSIAQQYKVPVRKLASWNAMAPRDPLIAGQKLVIWTREPVQVTITDSPYDAMPDINRIRRITYRVRRGDSLGKIANKFNVTTGQLQRWNRRTLSRNKYLYPGQRLVLYVDITKQSG
jgi:membrane-bound lytic murein transglycosylase D